MQIHNANFAQVVHKILFETGLAPGQLELEITETALVRDLNRALATLRRIKMLGVRIAMDDFGTGYSSLANLRAFPFDKIKIDGSFIKSVDSGGQAAAIVRSVLGLGRGLNLPVLAEGVETSAELSPRSKPIKTSEPTSLDGIEKYLGSEMICGIGPVYAKKLVRAFGEKVFDTIEAEPERLREVTGIGPVRADRITAANRGFGRRALWLTDG